MCTQLLFWNYPKRNEIKNFATKMNVFDGLIRTLNTTEERNSELEDNSIETAKTEKQRKTLKTKQNRSSKKLREY